MIETEVDYKVALAHARSLIDAEPGSLEEVRLEVLTLAIDVYEQIHYPIGPPSPDEAIKFRAEQEE